MKLEFLLCGSPTEGFFSQMAFFRFCLDQLGEAERDARVVCVFGDHEAEEIPARWQPYFENIEVHWAHEPGAENPNHVRQHDMRFDLLDPEADLSVLCDADVAVLAPVTPLAHTLKAEPALAGTIAHSHFPWPERDRKPQKDWRELARLAIGRQVPRPYIYTLAANQTLAESPFYINMGVFAGPPGLLAEYHSHDLKIRPRVAAVLGEWWAPQASLPLTCAKHDIPVRALPMRFNFPNDKNADARYGHDLKNIVFLHYLRGDSFARERIFATPEDFEAFLHLPLRGSNLVFQRYVAQITGWRYPFPA